jgi:hypothetical protein
MMTRRNWDEIERLESEMEAASLARLTHDRSLHLLEEMNELIRLLGPSSEADSSTAETLEDSDKIQSLVRVHLIFDAHARANT